MTDITANDLFPPMAMSRLTFSQLTHSKLIRTAGTTPAAGGGAGNALLLETGDSLLLEDGTNRLGFE